jgi:predicted O-methyltransferase YrrM
MRRTALSDKIFSLFLHNIKSSGHSDVIIPFRTWSNAAARFFRTDLFDMVFIDGDHAYSSVARDIRDYAPLVVDGGYICGDDLELQMSEVDRDLASTHGDKDLVDDASTGTDYHPGVTLAVGEFFGEVSVYAGFWVMQKVGGAWRKVALQ